MENFEKNLFQNADKSIKKENDNEKLDVQINLASPDDWEKCKNLRIQALESSDSSKLETNSKTLEKKIEFEKQKTEAEWRKELSSNNSFIFLSEKDQIPIGIGRASRVKKSSWVLHNGYVKKEFQDKGIGKRNFAMRLNEIIKRGGNEAITITKINNDKMINLAKSFGFKEMSKKKLFLIAKKIIPREWNPMEADLTDSEILKKINEVLDEK